MTFPYVHHHHDFVYLRLKAIVWSKNRVLCPTIVQAESDKTLADILLQEEPGKPLLVNCSGMTIIEDRALSQVKAALATANRPLMLLKAGNLEIDLKREVGEARATYLFDGTARAFVYGPKAMDEGMVAKFNADSTRVENDYVKQAVNGSFQSFDDGKLNRLSSTPLMANGVFNARALISDPVHFVSISLLLAEKVDQAIQADRPRKPCLLAVSLRASPFAAAIRLAGRDPLPIEIVDHMGPKHKILEEHSLKGMSTGIDYILVSDFVVGGTELKIAEAYAFRNGSRLTHAVTIGCALKPKAYSSTTKVLPLVQLHDCCQTADFKFAYGMAEEQ